MSEFDKVLKVKNRFFGIKTTGDSRSFIFGKKLKDGRVEETEIKCNKTNRAGREGCFLTIRSPMADSKNAYLNQIYQIRRGWDTEISIADGWGVPIPAVRNNIDEPKRLINSIEKDALEEAKAAVKKAPLKSAVREHGEMILKQLKNVVLDK